MEFESLPDAWICDNSPNHKHFFMNSWGSLRYGGYCGVCKYCNVCTITPQMAELALKNGYAEIDTTLKEQLEYHSNPDNFKPSRRFR